MIKSHFRSFILLPSSGEGKRGKETETLSVGVLLAGGPTDMTSFLFPFFT
jgi:hypothetical protein